MTTRLLLATLRELRIAQAEAVLAGQEVRTERERIIRDLARLTWPWCGPVTQNATRMTAVEATEGGGAYAEDL